MNARHKLLIKRKTDALAKAKVISENPEGEGDEPDLTEDQRIEFDAIMANVETLGKDIKREELLAAEAKTATPLVVNDDADISGGVPALMKDPKLGFESFGEFLMAVIGEGKNYQNPTDERLAIVAATPSVFGSEGVGADGGFLVAPEFGREVFKHSLEQDAILPLTDEQEIGGFAIRYPKDETTPWGTDGVRAFWEAEGAASTPRKPVLGFTDYRLHKLFGLVALTDELMQDAIAMGSFVTDALSRSIRWKSNDAFVNGSGAGRPLGILNAAALVSVAKDSGQTAATLTVTNVANMFARMIPSGLARAIWMINPDVWPQLITMVLNNQPIFQAPGALPNAPAGTLLGRPIMSSQHNQTLGTKGDIYFTDFKHYRTVTKAGGIATATSMHLYFDSDQMAFRSTFRIDGQPKIAASVTPARGSNNLSPFVTLDTRA